MNLHLPIAAFLTTCLMSGLAWSADFPVEFKKDTFKYVNFSDIPETTYTFENGVLEAKVKKSSSFLLLPFAQIKQVKSVQFEWQRSGEIKKRSAEDEKSKKADDFYFRLGLIISGEAPFIPFFAPAWVKSIREYAKLPSDHIKYLVVGTSSKPNSSWVSPYSDSMDYISLESTKAGDWESVKYDFDTTQKVVGLWLMSDGDNSDSTFEVKVRNLNLDILPEDSRKH